MAHEDRVYVVEGIGVLENKKPFYNDLGDNVGLWMIPMKVKYDDGVIAEANVPFCFEDDYKILKEHYDEADEDTPPLYFEIPK